MNFYTQAFYVLHQVRTFVANGIFIHVRMWLLCGFKWLEKISLWFEESCVYGLDDDIDDLAGYYDDFFRSLAVEPAGGIAV